MAAVAAPIPPTRLRRSPPRADGRDAMREWLLPTTPAEPSRLGTANATPSLEGTGGARSDVDRRTGRAPNAQAAALRQTDASVESPASLACCEQSRVRYEARSGGQERPSDLETAFQFLDLDAPDGSTGGLSPRSTASPVFPSSSPPVSPASRSPTARSSSAAGQATRATATPSRPKAEAPTSSPRRPSSGPSGTRTTTTARTSSNHSSVTIDSGPSPSAARPLLPRASASEPAAPVLATPRPSTPRSVSDGTPPTSQGSKDRSKRVSGLFRRGLFGRGKSEPETPSPVRPSAEPMKAGTASHVTADTAAPRRHVPNLSISTQAASGVTAYGPESPQPLPSHSPSERSLTPAYQGYFDRQPLATPQTWRSTLDNDTIVHLTLQHGHDEMRRQEIIYEIVETEKAFVESMRTIVAVYGQPIRSGVVADVPRSVARLFSRLERILDLHARLVSTLAIAAETLSSGRLVMHFAELFAPYVAELEVYQAYLLRFEAVTALLDAEAGSETGPFAAFLNDLADREEAGGMTLSSFLLKPIQRLMKYPLFFARLLDSTSKSHPDYYAIVELSEETDQMVRALQEVKMREEEYESLKRLETELIGLPDGFRVAERTRTLLFEGTVRQLHLTERDRAALDLARAEAAKPRASLRARAPSGSGLKRPNMQSGSLSATPRRSSDQVPSSRERPVSTASSTGASSSFSSASDSSPSVQSTSTRPSTASSERSATFAISAPAPTPVAPMKSMRAPPPPSLPSHNQRSSLVAPPISALPDATEHVKVHSPPRLRLRAKETALHIWVFSDLVLLARREDTAKLSRSERRQIPPPRRLLEDIGVCRLARLSDLAQVTDYEQLLEAAVQPLQTPRMPRESLSSLYLVPPLRLKSASTRPGSSSSALSAISGFSSRISSSAASNTTITPDLDTATFCNLHAALKSTGSETASPESSAASGGDYWISRVRQVRAEMKNRRDAARSTKRFH